MSSGLSVEGTKIIGGPALLPGSGLDISDEIVAVNG